MQQAINIQEVENAMNKYGDIVLSKNSNNNVIVMSVEQYKNKLKEKDYDLALIGCELPAVSDATYVLNKLGYSDKKLDKYITQLQNATSEEEIKSIYKTIQKYVKEKAIFISFGILNDYVVLNGRLKGELNSNDFDVYSGIDKIKMD